MFIRCSACCFAPTAAGSCISTVSITARTSLQPYAATVMELIRDTIKANADYAKTGKVGFIKSVQETLAAQQTSEVKKQKKRLAVCRKRFAELETIFKKMYEDYALGKLPDKRYEAMSADYGKEQDALEKEIAELQSSVERYEDGSGRAVPEDEEELCKVLERREKFRQNYLKRKVSGKQKEYEQHYNEKRKARLAANKAALFEDGAVLGANALAPVAES